METVTTITTGYCNDYLRPDHNQDLQVMFHIHTPQFTQQLLFRRQIFDMQDLTTHTVNEVQLKAKPQHTVTNQRQHNRPTCRLSPICVLLSTLSHCALIPTRKNSVHILFKNVVPVFVSTFF